MSRVKLNGSTDMKPSPNLDLRGKIGNSVKGIFKGRFESKVFPGKFNAMISVIDTDGDTSLYNKDTKENVAVDINEGDTVFLAENTVLARVFEKLQKGQKIEVVYLGKGKAKKGQKAPFLYDVFSLDGEEN